MNETHLPLRGKRMVFVAGEDEYESERTLKLLVDESAALGAEAKLVASVPDSRETTNLPGLEMLQKADLVVFYLRFRTLPEEQFRYIREYLESGRPIVAFRTSTHAFRYPDGHPLAAWNDGFGIDVLGAPWIRHYGHSSHTEVALAKGAEGHPILEDVPSRFEVRSWLYETLRYPPEGATILLNGHAIGSELTESNPHITGMSPVAWTRTHRWGGRVFMTTMGHPDDFQVAAFRTLVRNGIAWALSEVTKEQGEII